MIRCQGSMLFMVLVACGLVRASEPPIGSLEGLPRVLWKDAVAVEGRDSLVYGRLTTIVPKGRIQLLRFNTEEPPKFHGVVFQDDLAGFPSTLESAYLGKVLELRGIIMDYGGTPQIRLSSPSQIRVIDELPKLPERPQHRHSTRTTVVVATYNILNLFDSLDDPYHADEGTSAKPREQLQALADVIIALDADVLALQEVESRGYLNRFVEVFLPDAGYQHVVFVPGNDRRSSNVGLLSRLPVGRVVTNQHMRFEDQKGIRRGFERDVLEVQILPDGSDPFDVWVVHLKSNYDGREYASVIREAEARQVRKHLDRRLAENPAARIIVCGDFNDQWESDSVQRIVGEGSLRLHAHFDELAQSDRITYNRDPYRSMIDFLLLSPAMHEKYVPGSFKICQETPALLASDHNAVSLAIHLK